ncbi:MAG: hypothetical protein P8Y80_04215 [Acidobacteriota bacterium]|jgi:hypothetical protein
MEENNFGKKLEELEKPSARLPEHQRRLRLTFMNAKKSAWWGVLFILLTVAFIFSYLFPGSKFGLFSVFFGISLMPLILIGGLLSAFVLNLLSIIHISLDNNPSEIGFVIVIKKRLWNLIIVLLVFGLLGLMMLAQVAIQIPK